MLDVFLTIDTEISCPLTPSWKDSKLTQELDRDIIGTTRGGSFGLPFQMDVLAEHGLKGVFFIEALVAEAAGMDPLEQIVQLVQRRGQEVQLHLHVEWLARAAACPLAVRLGQDIKDFSEEEQAWLIARGLENLRRAGARNVCSFRSGNYGANFTTLRALAQNGIMYDTSYNVCYLGSRCGLRTPEPLLQPRAFEGVLEFPVSFFQDRPGHFRPAQLCACSSDEMEHMLMKAWESGWNSFVIVSHSFELIKRNHRAGIPPTPNYLVIGRWERLCRFLARHRDKFRTAGFADVVQETFTSGVPPRALRSNVYRTAWRMTEQCLGRRL